MTKISIFVLSAVLLLGCGGGDSASESDNTPPVTTPNNPTTPTTPTTPEPPVEELTPAQASRLLAQATFGATTEAIDKVIEMGMEEWIEDQFTKPASSHLEYIEALTEQLGEEELWRDARMEAWFNHVLTGEDQLRQRVAFALSEILVISEKSALGEETYGIANYYDTLVNHAFGNYRELLEQVTLSPMMGIYLSMLGNEKPDIERNIRPDENYARELMQLFSIGLVELNLDGSNKLAQGQPIATYDQDIIKGFAHVFTGWNFNGTTIDNWYWPEFDAIEPMAVVSEFHDNGEKQLLNGFVVPANQTAEQDLTMALDNIFNHSNVAPFISKQLIQRLVTSNPTPDYIERVATIFNDNGQGIKGDLKAVVKAILLDDEARNGHQSLPEQFGKVREPLLKATHLWRAFNASSPNDRFQFGWPDYFFAQAPLAAPSVFNFFSPSFAPPGELLEQGLVAPEMQIISENYLTRTSNFMAYSILWGHINMNDGKEDNEQQEDEKRILIDLNTLVPMIDDSEVLISHLNILMFGGTMSSEMQTILTRAFEQTDYMKQYDRLSNLLFLTMVSPQYAVQQ